MSAQRVRRALARMGADGVLAPDRAGGFGVYANGDRRRRPVVKLNAAEVRALEADGVIIHAGGDAFALSAPGAARLRREGAEPGEAFLAQHRPVIDRTVIERGGASRVVRGFDAHAALKRLAALKDSAGAPWLSDAELRAASQLRSDWEAGERGLVRGSDWSAPPNGSVARGPGAAIEGAMAAHCDARRRVAEALERLAGPLRRVVERVCLQEEGIEALERAEAWPARSGKIALKLALSQLAAR